MAGIKKSSRQWIQMMVGRLTRDIHNIHENHPEADEDLKKLANNLGYYIDVTTTENYWNKEPERSIADVWNDTIFSQLLRVELARALLFSR